MAKISFSKTSCLKYLTRFWIRLSVSIGSNNLYSCIRVIFNVLFQAYSVIFRHYLRRCLGIFITLSKAAILSTQAYSAPYQHLRAFINEHSTIWPNWPNHWAVFWLLICTVQLPVSSYNVTYAFHSQYTLYSCLNVPELLARNRRVMKSLSDCNWNWTLNH